MEEEEKRAERKPLVLDWEKLLPTGVRDEDQPLPVVVPSTTTVEPSPMSFDPRGGFDDRFEPKALSDHDLEVSIKRQQSIMGMASKLTDKGEKLKAHIKRLLEEKERRKFSRPDKGVEGGTKPTQLDNSIRSGAPDGYGQDRGSPHDHPQSSFGKEFSKRLDTNSNFMRVNASDKGFSNLGSDDHCGKRPNGRMSPNARKRRRSLPRQRPNRNSSSSYLNGNKHVFSNSNPNSKDSSTYSLRRHKDNMSNSFAKMQNAYQDLPTKELRTSKDQTFILVDEEEEEEEDCQTVEAEECGEELPESMKDAKIYYPSRDDPDPVVICYADLYCLAPETYLTSTIMNFYIRYLQQQVAPTNTMIHDYLFFNTYFYEKLKEAVTCKGTDKNSKFLKFRRWWKGVNVFQKAYVLIPIHQDLHWSLVIICIPDKEDESGPIILHLDSLGLHYSRSVFNNIKSYMKEEWNCLKQEIDPTDLPIAEDIWEDLPSRIEEKKVMVPRQKNDYDCGLFVLFFMERFILDAPQRLVKEKDLPLMFGRDWFHPKEASGLRKKIRNLLKEEFQNAAEVARLSQTSSS